MLDKQKFSGLLRIFEILVESNPGYHTRHSGCQTNCSQFEQIITFPFFDKHKSGNPRKTLLYCF